MDRKRVGVVIFDEIEVLDFCGLFGGFSATRLNEARHRGDACPIQGVLISRSGQRVETAGGMKVIPDGAFDQCPSRDILVVPGGWGTRKEMRNPAMLSFVRSRASEVQTLASVCTGALILGNAGL